MGRVSDVQPYPGIDVAKCSAHNHQTCMAKGSNQKPANGSALDFEAQLWAAADKMRSNIFGWRGQITPEFVAWDLREAWNLR